MAQIKEHSASVQILDVLTKKSIWFTLINNAVLCDVTQCHLGDRGQGGAGRVIVLPLLLGFIFQATDGAQMQVEWVNTDLKVCLYWPDFQPYHFKMVSAVPASSRNIKQYQDFILYLHRMIAQTVRFVRVMFIQFIEFFHLCGKQP